MFGKAKLQPVIPPEEAVKLLRESFDRSIKTGKLKVESTETVLVDIRQALVACDSTKNRILKEVDKTISELIKALKDRKEELLASIDDYLKANSITASKDASGLRFTITQAPQANAIAPLSSDSVVINYTGKILSTGAVFYQTTTPESYRLNKTGTLKVWQKGLVFFKQGTKATLYTPSGLAYGSYEKYGVPPNTNVVFEVEMVKVNSN